MLVPFTKMHGLGNDFVLIDQRESMVDLTSVQIEFIADRRLGVVDRGAREQSQIRAVGVRAVDVVVEERPGVLAGDGGGRFGRRAVRAEPPWSRQQCAPCLWAPPR